MGKKKTPKKTKELSVAIAESSSIGGESAQQQQQQTPRKRGRPRKVIDKIESGEIKEERSQDLSEAQVMESESKRPKMSKEEEEEEEEEPQMKEVPAQSSVVGDTKEEPQRSRRARRKSKPHKSSQN